MNPSEQLRKKIDTWKRQLDSYTRGPALTILGNEAISWVHQHYRKEHWYNGSGWQNWKKPKRFNPEGTTSEKYGTLLSKRDHLFRSFKKIENPGARNVLVYNDVPYAKIHNEGGVIDQVLPITPKMRKWAWAMYYKTLGYKRGRGRKRAPISRTRTTHNGKTVFSTGNALADKYAALALTKNQVIKRSVKMPKRPFLYANSELGKVLREKLKEGIMKQLGFR